MSLARSQPDSKGQKPHYPKLLLRIHKLAAVKTQNQYDVKINKYEINEQLTVITWRAFAPNVLHVIYLIRNSEYVHHKGSDSAARFSTTTMMEKRKVSVNTLLLKAQQHRGWAAWKKEEIKRKIKGELLHVHQLQMGRWQKAYNNVIAEKREKSGLILGRVPTKTPQILCVKETIPFRVSIIWRWWCFVIFEKTYNFRANW